MSKSIIGSELGLLLLMSTLSGASYSLTKIGIETIPPVTLIAARTVIAASILLLLLAWRGVKLPRQIDDWKRFGVQACLHSALPFTLVAWAQQHTDAAIAVILNSAAPIFVFAIKSLQRNEPIPLRSLCGAAIGFLGVCLVVGLGPGGSHREIDLLAYGAIIAAAICYAGAALFGRTFRELDPMVPAAGSLICGACVLVPLSIGLERPWQLAPSDSSLLALLGLSFFVTALSFTIYFRLVGTVGPVATTTQSYLRVPIGIFIAVVFLGERLSSTVWGGLLLILVGVTAMTLPHRRQLLAK
ncbi:drug/metabolite transporter (DMT)-like permease [Rhizobium sp. ERR 1071]|uniref:DMT family transporter n=1 Tax=Rhizobium sp. ERR 1071 TaxID=2572677 RepID=UPI00119A6081|nr:DMT family transporter [Rhizobium sp. ERR1071]TWB08254.1 drug/metabolite transporter (DMT)-like permease [Rhizobium sp. ERR1071]